MGRLSFWFRVGVLGLRALRAFHFALVWIAGPGREVTMAISGCALQVVSERQARCASSSKR